ncbi:MAG TPA: LysM peptidoglycan-binding domain-containing protein [Chloroflexi bacterium]|nr:LysM peptidoglycan-binding domain-containing protein [Chloroflexota bacterium]
MNTRYGNDSSRRGANRKSRRCDLAAVVVIALSILGVLLFIAFSIRPEWQRSQALADQLAVAEQGLKDGGQVPADLENQLKAAQAKQDEAANRFLDPWEASAAMNALHQYADQSGIDLLSLQHHPSAVEVKRTAYDTWTFRLRGVGTLPQLTTFLSRIEETASASFQVNDLSITETEYEQHTLVMTITLYIFPHTSTARVEPAELEFERTLPPPSPTRTVAEQLESELDQVWQADDWEQAIHLIQQILDLKPGDGEMMGKLYAAHVNYGHQLVAQRRWEDAKRAFSIALDVRPGGQEARAGLRRLSSEWTPPPLPATDYIVHVVQRGDNLFRIALRYGVTVDTVRIANGLTGSAIYVGQRLRIPVR